VANYDRLTKREYDVLRLVAQRLPNKKIASRLHISIYTVKNHVHAIIEKLHATDRHDAVRIGLGITLSDETRCDACPVKAKAAVISQELRKIADEIHKGES
jgi:DNA-binding CsgD family transcriptional regulator